MSHQILPWGIALKPGGPTKVPVMASEASFEVLHVTACALGEKPDEGPHVVKVIVEDADQNEVPIVMGTLCAKSRIFQFPADMGLSEDTTFINTGKTPVFLSGYKTISMYEVTDDMDSDEEGGFYSDEEESDDEPPQAVPIGKTNGRLAAMAAQARPHTAAAAAASSDEDEDEVEDEEEDEEEEEDSDASLPGELDSDDVVGVVEEDLPGGRGMMDMDADDEDEDEEEDEDEDELEDEEEDEEEDSEDEPAPPSKAAAAATKPFKGTPQLQQRRQQQQPSKRPLEAATPQPAKKQKPAAAAVPSSAPAKVQGGGGQQAGGVDAAYHQKLLSVLKAESAPITVAALGGKVGPKPSKDFRLGRYISEHPELFVYNAATQTVVLKKK